MTDPYDPAHAYPRDLSKASFVDRTEGEAFADTFSSFVNNMNSLPKAVALDKLMRDHRTLQQGMMRFCMAFIARMADQSHDLRNEASVKLARQIMERTDYEKRSLPFI